MINETSIYCTILLAGIVLPQLLFFLFKGRKTLPHELYRGRFLFYSLTAFLSYLATVTLTLFFSNDLGPRPFLIIWLVLAHSCLMVILVLIVIFIMNGYEARYMFKKYVIPSPINFLIVAIYWLTLGFTRNYWAMIPASLFTVFSLLWSIKAYLLTKPLIGENIPLREDDE